MKKPSYYLTTPIYYVNDAPHIGHAYTTLACDVLARFKRLDGYDVLFLTGTDEHGQKVAKSAEKAGVSPQQFCDKVSQNFRDLCDAMNFSNDDFIRTTEKRHIEAVRALWLRLKERGEIYLSKYSGWYAVRDEAFYAEDELKDTQDGKKIAPSGAECEWLEEPSYFFRLSAWQEPLLKFYADNPDFIAPTGKRNEVLSFVRSGLKDLSVSRTTFSWGISVPEDEKHVMYVWLDALTNYITAAGFPHCDEAPYQNRWPAQLHMVGKDILRFHTIYWPAFLLAAGLKPPERVFAHGWWTNEGQKISKSLGNVIDPFQLIETYGRDPVRYFLLREVPFGNDGDFSRAAILQRINRELANDFGNLAQRVLSQIQKNLNSILPSPGEFTQKDKSLLNMGYNILPAMRLHMDQQAFQKSLEEIWSVIAEANRYVDEQAPWALKKTDPTRMGTVLYVLAELLRLLAIISQPFMPESMEKLLMQLGQDCALVPFENLTANDALKPGTILPAPSAIFPRIDAESVKE